MPKRTFEHVVSRLKGDERKRKMELYHHLSASIGKSVKEFMDATGFKRSLVFKYLREFKSEGHVETRERGKRYLSLKLARST